MWSLFYEIKDNRPQIKLFNTIETVNEKIFGLIVYCHEWKDQMKVFKTIEMFLIFTSYSDGIRFKWSDLMD